VGRPSLAALTLQKISGQPGGLPSIILPQTPPHPEQVFQTQMLAKNHQEQGIVPARQEVSEKLPALELGCFYIQNFMPQ
jgi:hypothetical protein